MTRLTKTSLFAVLGITVAFAGATDVSACGRRGGGYSGGYGGGYYGGYSSSYSHTTYRQPVYRQPVVQQQPVTPVQQQQPIQQQPVQQPVAQPQQATQPQAVQQQAVQTAQTPAASASTTQTQNTANAQQTALDMLSSFGGVETTPAATPDPKPAAFNGVGTWSATLSNGATIQLDMRTDGSFTWTANKSGKQSTFSGTFTLNDQSLTLIRSDSQKLTGNLLSAEANGFTFKLDGVKDNGVKFSRS